MSTQKDQLNSILHKSSNSDNYAWMIGTIGIMITMFLCSMLNFETKADTSKFIIYSILTAVLPILSFFWVKYTFAPFQKFGKFIEIFVSFNLAFILIGSIWYISVIKNFPIAKFNLTILRNSYFLCALLLTISLLFLNKNLSNSILSSRKFKIANSLLYVFSPTAFVIATILPLNRWGVAFNVPATIVGFMVLSGMILYWHKNKAKTHNVHNQREIRFVVNLLVFSCPFVLTDMMLSYDLLHYTAYLGPAVAVENGRVPLQDVFCQYGLSYLIYNLGFRFLPVSYSSAALVTSIANSLYMLCSLVILRKLIKKNLPFLILGISLPFFFWLTYSNSSATMTPSHGGLRYLPIFLVAMSLILLNAKKTFSWGTIASICIAWAWSFEAAIYCTFIYSIFIIAHASVNGAKNIKEVILTSIGSLAKLFGLLCLFVTFVCVAYNIFTGKLPRYDLYLNLVLSYVGPDPFMDYKSYVMPGFYTWLIVLMSYVVSICLVARQCFRPMTGNSDWIPKLAVLSALGLVTSIYCLLGTVTHTFRPIILPFYLLLFWAVAYSIETHRTKTQKISNTALGLIPSFLFIGTALSGAAVGNFLQSPSYGAPNSIFLKQILNPEIQQSNARQFFDFNYSCGTNAEDNNACLNVSLEERALIDKWQSQQNTLFIFYPNATYVNVLYNKPHFFPLSMSYVDGFSPKLFQYILSKSADLMNNNALENQTVIVYKDHERLNNLEQSLLKNLSQIWLLEQIDESEKFYVYKLIKDSTIAKGSLLKLGDIGNKRRNSL